MRKAGILASDVFGTGELTPRSAIAHQLTKLAGYTFGYNRSVIGESRPTSILTVVGYA